MPKQAPTVLKISNFKRNNPKAEVYIRTFQEHKADHPFVMSAHAHDFYLVMLFTKGSGSHTIDFNEYKISRGAMFFMSPSEVHSWKLSDDADGYILFFNSSFHLMEALSRQLFNLPFFRTKNKISYALLNEKDLKQTSNIFKSMLTENSFDSKYLPFIMRSYMDVLLYKLASVIKADALKQETMGSVLPELETLIGLYYKEHHSVLFYAEKLHTTSQQLNATAKNYLDKTVQDLIHERVMAEARRLLVYSSLTVSEIAYELNFKDNSYFNRFFKKEEGLTPDQFRKKF